MVVSDPMGWLRRLDQDLGLGPNLGWVPQLALLTLGRFMVANCTTTTSPASKISGFKTRIMTFNKQMHVGFSGMGS